MFKHRSSSTIAKLVELACAAEKVGSSSESLMASVEKPKRETVLLDKVIEEAADIVRALEDFLNND